MEKCLRGSFATFSCELLRAKQNSLVCEIQPKTYRVFKISWRMLNVCWPVSIVLCCSSRWSKKNELCVHSPSTHRCRSMRELAELIYFFFFDRSPCFSQTCDFIVCPKTSTFLSLLSANFFPYTLEKPAEERENKCSRKKLKFFAFRRRQTEFIICRPVNVFSVEVLKFFH